MRGDATFACPLSLPRRRISRSREKSFYILSGIDLASLLLRSPSRTGSVPLFSLFVFSLSVFFLVRRSRAIQPRGLRAGERGVPEGDE